MSWWAGAKQRDGKASCYKKAEGYSQVDAGEKRGVSGQDEGQGVEG